MSDLPTATLEALERRIRAEAVRAHAKHGNFSMFGSVHTDDSRLTILTEELGEVARALNDTRLGKLAGMNGEELRAELVQVAAMALTWLARLETPAELEASPPRPRLERVLMFDNGTTAAFVAGEQCGPAQVPWLACWLEELERRGFDPAELAVTLPNGWTARPFRLEAGGWNWRIDG